MREYQFTVVYEQDEDGRILAICPALQGCYTEGETEEEARANIREAIQAHIESRLAHGEPIHTELSAEDSNLTAKVEATRFSITQTVVVSPFPCMAAEPSAPGC